MVRIFFLLCLTLHTLAQDVPSCNSKIYCQGNLLHTVQMAKLYPDSKTFVDMKLKHPEKIVLESFAELMNTTQNHPTQKQIQDFVNNNFENGNEFEAWTPKDYTKNPKILARIQDEEIRNFAQSLVKVWPKLAKKVKKDVIENPELYTLLPVENGFIIPGGRFKEFYYWDSYWIIKGLLLSDMPETVKGMLDNFLSIVDKNGFVPNGARIYYLNRSQPPLLTLMVKSYIDATNDKEWLKTKIPLLDKELRFWLTHKLINFTKNGITYSLAHYNSQSGSPRPESYFEDFTTAQNVPDPAKKELWKELKSCAESGWDFSSRWIVDENGGNQANLTRLQTRRIIPVDLNSYLCQAFRILAEFYLKFLKDYRNAKFWFEQSNRWAFNIAQVFYHEEDGIWYDFDAVLGKPRRFFYPSNFAPLWTDSYIPGFDVAKKAVQYFRSLNLTDFQGGIPTSLENTHEQWDYPNAWPPLQSIVILGLYRTGDCEAKNLAKDFAHRWIRANMIGFNNTQEMFEKYDATVPGQYGGGGEYVVQSGFGWSNGVAFELIDQFFAK